MKHIITLLVVATTLQFAYSQRVVTGIEYKSATEASIDILTNQLTLLKVQAQNLEHGSPYLGITYRYAPARLLINDGTLSKGQISRMQIQLGYSGAFFFGDNFDMSGVYDKGYYKERLLSGQNLAFCGLNLKYVQFYVGLLSKQQTVLDGNYEFISKESNVATQETKFNRDFTVYSIYLKSGAYIAAVYGKTLEVDHTTGVYKNEKRLSELRLNLQPYEQYFPKPVGLPFLDLFRMDRFKNYYNEYKNFYNNYVKVDTVKEKSDPFEFSFGSENFLIKGLRFSVTANVRPTVFYRKTEINYSVVGKHALFGFRALFYKSWGERNFSFDAATLFYGKKAIMGFSYSYNSPDGSTFLPLTKMHVIGFQLHFGDPRLARPLTPYTNQLISFDRPVVEQ